MTKHFLPNKWLFVSLLGVLILVLGFRFLGPWEKFMSLWSDTPVPYHFESLRNVSDEKIAQFMSGAKEVGSFHEAGAPDSNFPEPLWDSDPKKAALAFAEANRSPTHRKNYQLWVDSNPSLIAPDAGWLALSNSYVQTVLRFGIDQPFLLHATTIMRGMNDYVDGKKHTLQLIPLSPDEAHFLADTAFWLAHLKSMPTRKGYSGSSIFSSHESYGTLEWQIDKQPRLSTQGTLWSSDAISDRWKGDSNDESQLNLSHFLFTQALPKHLGKRWKQRKDNFFDSYKRPLAERLMSQDDTATQAKFTQIILTSLAHHDVDPFPAIALVAIAQCAGDVGLADTLPALEKLAAKLPLPSADEAELITLDAQFRFVYPAPKDPDERKKWERHQSLETALKDDFLTQVRRPLTQAIRQLRALGQPAKLRELAQNKYAPASWALHQLYRLQPDAYAEVLILRFATEKEWPRRQIFETLATLNPAAARRLRDSLTEKEQADLLFEITHFERVHDPARAQSRIPVLLETAEKPTEIILGPGGYPTSSKRGPAIEMLAKLPLSPADQKRFEALLLKELMSPENLEIFGECAIGPAATAIIHLPNPDRFWDALYEATAVEEGSIEFDSLLNDLATLALATPEPRLSQLADLLRPRLQNHEAQVTSIFKAALALDLRSLAPEIEHFSTSGPEVPDSEDTNSCKNGPDKPCLHRYHSARHINALWQEPDPNTRARMWAALLLNSPYDFAETKTIPSCLRDRCRSAITAASPEIYQQLVAKARATNDLPREITDWLNSYGCPL